MTAAHVPPPSSLLFVMTSVPLPFRVLEHPFLTQTSLGYVSGVWFVFCPLCDLSLFCVPQRAMFSRGLTGPGRVRTFFSLPLPRLVFFFVLLVFVFLWGFFVLIATLAPPPFFSVHMKCVSELRFFKGCIFLPARLTVYMPQWYCPRSPPPSRPVSYLVETFFYRAQRRL